MCILYIYIMNHFIMNEYILIFDNIENEKKEENNMMKIKYDKYFNNKEKIYYEMIDSFFCNCEKNNIYLMINIINGQSNISLRLLDWFVSRFSKTVILFNENKKEQFDIHISYKAQLKTYKKKYFDPFRRQNKFMYMYDKNKCINTTLGQLNFFRWAISNNVISYIHDNINMILSTMTISNKKYKYIKNEKNQKINDKNKDNINNLSSLLEGIIYF